MGDKHGVQSLSLNQAHDLVQNKKRFGELVLVSHMVCDVPGCKKACQNNPLIDSGSRYELWEINMASNHIGGYTRDMIWFEPKSFWRAGYG